MYHLKTKYFWFDYNSKELDPFEVRHHIFCIQSIWLQLNRCSLLYIFYMPFFSFIINTKPSHKARVLIIKYFFILITFSSAILICYSKIVTVCCIHWISKFYLTPIFLNISSSEHQNYSIVQLYPKC